MSLLALQRPYHLRKVMQNTNTGLKYIRISKADSNLDRVELSIFVQIIRLVMLMRKQKLERQFQHNVILSLNHALE